MRALLVQLAVVLLLAVHIGGTPPKVCLVSQDGFMRTPTQDFTEPLAKSSTHILTSTISPHPDQCRVIISVRTNKWSQITMAEVKVGQHPNNANAPYRRYAFDVFSNIAVFRGGYGLGPLAQVDIPLKDDDNDRYEVRIRALDPEGWKMVIFCDGVKFVWFKYKKFTHKYVRIRVRDPDVWDAPCWE